MFDSIARMLPRIAAPTMAACLGLHSVVSGLAQAPQPQPLVPQRPSTPTGTIVPPGFSIELQPGGTGIPGAPNDPVIEPAVSATFEPATARVGRPAEYRVTITGNERVLELPGLKAPEGLQLEVGARGFSPMRLNGQMVGTSTLRFSAMPIRPGEFTVPSFPVQIGARRVMIPAATLIVIDNQPGEAVYQPVRAVIDVPKRDYFIGETIDARVLFMETPDEQPQYVQHVVKSSGPVLFKPSTRSRSEQIQWEGKPTRALVMPVQITPLVAGEAEVNCQVIVHVSRTNLGGRGILTQATIDVPSTRFRVLPLPQVRPAGFTGAIGQFSVAQPKLSATEAEVGEPIVMTVAIAGEGNLDGVPAPDLEAQAEWTSYRPTSEIQRDEDLSRGTKTFTYTLIPKQVGRRGTPAIPFAYFDPVKRVFVDITIPPQPIMVKASSAPAAPATTGASDTPAPQEPPRDAEPILTGLAEQSGAWHSSLAPDFRTFLWLQAVPPIALLGLWIWRRRSEYMANHPEILRRRRALAASRKALAAARDAARRGDSAAFVEASARALREAAAPLDTAQAESLTREEVLRQVHNDERAARAAKTIFEKADTARYASRSADLSETSKLLPEVEHAVAQLSSR